MSDFRRALIAAAESAQKEGGISRAELFKIRVASRNPRVCAMLEEECTSHASYSGVGAIDWSALLEFLKGLIPLIAELIKLFSS